jgi:adenylylsulfate kinase
MSPGPPPPAADGPVSSNIVREHGRVDADQRRQLFGHGAATVWFTGLSGSGKSTLAFALEEALVRRGVASYVLDGDNVRHGLNRDLGFSPADRAENIRRIGEVCRLLQNAGLVVLTAFISPYREDRDQVRRLHPAGTFIEVHVDTPIEVCEQRDVKGLYAKARRDEIPGFSGVSAPYEAPEDPEVRIDTSEVALDDGVQQVIEVLARTGIIPTRAG